jgi:hypothetical protein
VLLLIAGNTSLTVILTTSFQHINQFLYLFILFLPTIVQLAGSTLNLFVLTPIQTFCLLKEKRREASEVIAEREVEKLALLDEGTENDSIFSMNSRANSRPSSPLNSPHSQSKHHDKVKLSYFDRNRLIKHSIEHHMSHDSAQNHLNFDV